MIEQELYGIIIRARHDELLRAAEQERLAAIVRRNGSAASGQGRLLALLRRSPRNRQSAPDMRIVGSMVSHRG